MSGHTSKAIIMLNGLKAEGTEPVLLLWALTRELRLLTQIAETQQQGVPLAQALQQFKVWKNRESLMTQAVRRLPLSELYALLQQAHQVDLAIKGMLKGESPWRLISGMVMRVCGQRLATDI